jgi:DNA-binding MarR family transcriptional regulator
LLDALADATRRAIFNRLLAEPQPVKVLAADLPISQPAVSQHLKTMREAGLVMETRQGRYHIYGVNPAALDWLSVQFGALRDDVLNGAEERQDSLPSSAAEDPVDAAMAQWATVWPGSDPLPLAVVVRLFLIVRHMEVLAERACAPHGIRIPELHLLGTLDRLGDRDSTLAELASTSLLSLPTAACHLNHIEQLGLVTRSAGEGSQAVNRLRITPKGRGVLHAIIEHEKNHEHAALYNMAEPDLKQLAKLLRPLLRDLQQSAQQDD